MVMSRIRANSKLGILNLLNYNLNTSIKISLKYSSVKKPVYKANLGEFVQDQPRLSNQYLSDYFLRSYLSKHIPVEIFKSFEEDLIEFGAKVATNINDLSLECERNQPKLVQQDAWGRRVDVLETCDAWKKMKEISAKEGLISIAYERKHGEWSRLYQMVKLYLFAPSSGLYSCPLAMTDGATKTLEVLSLTNHAIFGNAYERLTSRDPSKFWTSGQWMTEKMGGSDVANGTETVATQRKDGTFNLNGYKFFSSASDSDLALTLARVADERGQVVQGTKGLTLFYLETKTNSGELNGIQMIRLKDKLGTRQLPTAELLLDGTIAYKLSDLGRGVSAISTMLSLTRLHNSCASVGAMRRIINLASDYAKRRSAFGQPIISYPLHIQTLDRMEVETGGNLILFLEVSRLLGKIDCGKATERENLIFRIITPILKLYSAKQAVKIVSEGLECFGGQGYMEDTGFPCILRDAQVLPIWEGTTNILSLDVIRSVSKSNGATLNALMEDVASRLENCTDSRLKMAKEKVEAASKIISEFVITSNPDQVVVGARDLAFTIARTYIGALLIDNAKNVPSTYDLNVANSWCNRPDLSILEKNYRLNGGLFR